MQELTEKQIERQDYVDNAIFGLLQILAPTTQELEWNIEIIGLVRDAIEYCFVERLQLCGRFAFYPYISE
jgi:hypothetical protein